MKKVFSLILAVAMVLSLASVAFAAAGDSQEYILKEEAKDVKGSYGYVTDMQKIKDKKFTDTNNMVFGQKYYFPIINTSATVAAPKNAYEVSQLASFAKQIGSLKVSYNFTEGAEFIKNVTIGTVFVTTDINDVTVINRNVYAIIVETQGDADKAKNVVGEIKVTGTPGAGSLKGIDGVVDNKNVETTISIDAKIDYEKADVTAQPSVKTISGGVVTTTTDGGVGFKSVGTSDGLAKVKVTSNAAKKFYFNGDSIVASLEDAKAFDGTLISFNTYELADVVASNPDAAVMFYNLTCNFKQSAEVTIKPIDEEADNYLYQILPSGAMKDLTSFYSVDDDAFVLNCRKLTGTYIVSDMPLVF